MQRDHSMHIFLLEQSVWYLTGLLDIRSVLIRFTGRQRRLKYLVYLKLKFRAKGAFVCVCVCVFVRTGAFV
jgi:hypothetical protein